ncbi:MAG: DUF86 domain-containing protein [Clostridia bacterium]|nr:DUF86 domain-containing protein [Clostridia bacterium]
MKDDKIYLIHIIECIEWIESYTKLGKGEFINTKLIQDGVIRNLEVMGEATKRASNETRKKHKEVPWRRIAGLRDVLIHDYFGVDLEIVWNVVEDELPKLKNQLRKII